MSTSGQILPIGDISTHWKQIIAEDFNTDVPVGGFPGTVYPQWGVYKDWWPDTVTQRQASRRGYYMPSKTLSVANSCLTLNLHYDAAINVFCLGTAYPILDRASPRGGALWGRYSQRFRVDPGLKGYKTAWLLWPDAPGTWPAGGEIDYPEGNLDDVMHCYVHHMNGTSGSDQDGFNTNVPYVDPASSHWHTSTMIWYPKAGVPTFEAYLDSKLVATTSNRVPNLPMHYDWQNETSTQDETPDKSVAGSIYLDWFTAYEWQG